MPAEPLMSTPDRLLSWQRTPFSTPNNQEQEDSTLRQEKVSPSWKVRLSVQLRCMSREAPQKLAFGSSSPAVQLSPLTHRRAEHPSL